MSEHIHKFWMVYGLGRSAPTYQHPFKHEAVAEAQRLAKLNPGSRFVVLAAVGCYEAEEPTVTAVPVRKITDDEAHSLGLDIPF